MKLIFSKLNKVLTLAVFGLALSSCQPKSKTSLSQLELGIDLGKAGNQEVAQIFKSYLAKAPGCRAAGSGTRVILTGFGLFEGVSFNVSGSVVAQMSSAKFWPTQVLLAKPPSTQGLQVIASDMTEQDFGGKALNRSLVIDGKNYELCFLTVDVKWDLAAAIIIQEMQSFQPQLVMMTGLGGDTAIFESGASNNGILLSGFQPNGSADENNTPISTPVLPPGDSGVQAEVAMTWDNVKLQQATVDPIGKLGFQVEAPASARPDNDYICNNVSYVVREATLAPTLNLAGGELALYPKLGIVPKIGFFHYPYASTDDVDSLMSWSVIIATAITKTLNP